MTNPEATQNGAEAIHHDPAGERVAALAARLKTALDQWMRPGGRVEVHVTTFDDESTRACQIWSVAPGMDAGVRESIDLDGASLLEIERAVVQARYVYPILAVAVADWSVEHENGKNLAVLEVRDPWS